MEQKDIDFKLMYPNLIILLGTNKYESLFRQLQKSFHEFQYVPFLKEDGTCYKHEIGRQVSTCRIMQGSVTPVCLAEGEGSQPCDAEQQAVEKLLNKLCDSCFVIKANPQYFTTKYVPPAVLSVDPSQSHVYKVVFLSKNSKGIPFPKPVSGAIDYVENYNQLMDYIKGHVKSDTKADLFILNVLKSDRAGIKPVCQKNGFQVKFLVGCSDMGIHVFRNLSTLLVLQGVLKDAGKNVKYKLIGPRDKYGDNEDKFDKKLDEKVATAQYEHTSGEIVMNPWLSDHLVLMEVVTEWNELESTREIIWRSVRDCPDTQEFIIEKNKNAAGVILADALIDRNVVGRARGFKVDQVKTEAAENAMKNLSSHCYYIVAKKSYFGSSKELPYFLQGMRRSPETKVYRIADRNSGPPQKILQQFKSAWQEDLYFLEDFSNTERQDIESLAKKMNFLVRWIGRESYLCVYKRRKPKEVLMELLSTHSMENEKYKLIVPPSKTQKQLEDRATYREWSDKKIARDEEANVQGFDTSQKGSFAHLDEQSNTPENPPLQNTDRPHTEGSGKDTTDPPSWVMNFIKSAKKKPPTPLYKKKCPTEPKRCKDDVYSRWKFEAPKVILPPTASTSNVNFNTVNQRSVRPAWRGDVPPNNYDYSRYKYVAPKVTQPPVDSTSNVNFNRANHGSVQPASNVTPKNYDHSRFNKYGTPKVTVPHVDSTSNVNFNRANYESVQPASNVTPNNYDHSRFNKYVTPKVTQPPVDSRSNVDFERANHGLVQPASNVNHNNYDHSIFNKYVTPKVTQPPVDFRSNVDFERANHGLFQPASNVNQNNYDHSTFNKYVAPKVTQPPVDSRSNVDCERADQRLAQPVGRDNITPSDSNGTGGSTLSERLQKMLEDKNRSVERDSRSLENYQGPPYTNKRSSDRGFDVGEPSWKIGKYTTHPYSSQQNMIESKSERGEQSNNYVESGNPTTGAFSHNRGANERTSSCASSDTAKSFNLKTESTQRDSTLWDRGTKQQYDQRPGQSSSGNKGFSNLFDFNGPQDVTPQDFSSTPFPTPPKSRNRKPPWKKNKSKGHNFAKLVKYGKKGPH